MVTYRSTNTKRARPDVYELPRTDIQRLAAPFPILLSLPRTGVLSPSISPKDNSVAAPLCPAGARADREWTRFGRGVADAKTVFPYIGIMPAPFRFVKILFATAAGALAGQALLDLNTMPPWRTRALALQQTCR
jgi:hypothetical protein